MKATALIATSLVLSTMLFMGCGGSSDKKSGKESMQPDSGNGASDGQDGNGGSQTDEGGDPFSKTLQQEEYYKYLWHIDAQTTALNQKGYSIDPHADINITGAWRTTKGSGVIVAVIDDSFDVEHEDLKANIYKAYDTDNNTTDVSYTGDDASHGNTAAGFIAAPINGKGIIGTAPESRLLLIKQEDQADSSVIAAFEYAKAQGARVISCSWGSENISEAFDEELKALYDAGITILFASGNDGKSLDGNNEYGENIKDESESNWVIGVGATDERNDVADYSNYGSNIDILAPGGWEPGVLGIDDTGEKGSPEQKDLVNNNYAFTQGTSFSTPIAAGVVALMYSTRPDITPAQVRNILIQTADKIGGAAASYNENGFDEKRAYGKIDTGKALEAVRELSN